MLEPPTTHHHNSRRLRRNWADWVRTDSLSSSLRVRIWLFDSSSILTYITSSHPFSCFSTLNHPSSVCIRDTKSLARPSTDPCQSTKNAQLYTTLRTPPLPRLASNCSADHPGRREPLFGLCYFRHHPPNHRPRGHRTATSDRGERTHVQKYTADRRPHGHLALVHTRRTAYVLFLDWLVMSIKSPLKSKWRIPSRCCITFPGCALAAAVRVGCNSLRATTPRKTCSRTRRSHERPTRMRL